MDLANTSAQAPAPLRQVSQAIGGWIDKMGAIWVEGEIAQLNRRPGMCFLTLRDLQSNISVSVTCLARVLDSSAAPITEGARVVVHAKPDFYVPTGRLSLNAREVRPVGEGELLARLQRLKQNLAAEGLFEERLKKSLPFLPNRIGLITGRASAAERDVLENSRLRWPDVDFDVKHTLVQGAEAAGQVIEALRALDVDPMIDVIIIARGGGSVEDLLPFSDEGLVRAVAAASTPIVSAIGHEPDTPLIDLAADLRATTPTDAAKQVVPDVSEQRLLITQWRDRARSAVALQVDHRQQGLTDFLNRPSMRDPGARLGTESETITQNVQRMRVCLQHRLERSQDEINNQLMHLRGLSPDSTLQRGYAIAVNADGHLASSVHDVNSGDELHIRFHDGRAYVTAHKTEEL